MTLAAKADKEDTMKKTRIFAGALALTLLTGCSAGPDLVASPDDLAFQAADLKRDSQLFTVDGVGVNAEEYLFWLVNAIAIQKYSGGLSDDADWSQAQEGQPSAGTLKADALETAKVYQTIRNRAAQLGVELSAEEREEMETELEEVFARYGGEEEFQRGILDEQCISMEGYRALNEVAYLNRTLKEKLEADGTLTVTDGDLEAYVAQKGIYGAKHILVSTRHTNADGSHEEFTEAERAQALELVKDLREQLRASGDSEEMFDELMREYSEDGRDEEGNLYAPEGYLYVYPQEKVTSYYTQMAMVQEFEAGALSLEVGQISEPIETDYGYHLILRKEPDMEQARQEYVSSDYKFNELLRSWAEEAEVVTTKAYDELDPQVFYNKLQQLLDAREAARAAQTTPAPTQSAAPEGSSAPEESAPAN